MPKPIQISFVRESSVSKRRVNHDGIDIQAYREIRHTEVLSGEDVSPALPLFTIAGNFLRSFHALLGKTEKPSREEIAAAYVRFLDTKEFSPVFFEMQFDLCEKRLDFELELLDQQSAFFKELSLEGQPVPAAFKYMRSDLAFEEELLLAEAFALCWVARHWLNVQNRRVSISPALLSEEERKEHFLFPLSPLELGPAFFRVRLEQVGIGLCFSEGRNKNDLLCVSLEQSGEQLDVRFVYGGDNSGCLSYGGITYKANFLLQLAWVELLYALENNIPAGICTVCSMVFPLYKQHNKIVCSLECRKVYDKHRRERFGPEYFREAQRKSRNQKAKK